MTVPFFPNFSFSICTKQKHAQNKHYDIIKRRKRWGLVYNGVGYCTPFLGTECKKDQREEQKEKSW